MCGIIGFLTPNPGLIPTLLDGLLKLQNRGYDSAGVSLCYNNDIHRYVAVSDNHTTAIKYLEVMVRKYVDNYYMNGLAHTRWATHGTKTKENAHPHHCMCNRFSMVHNGIIENYEELAIELQNIGYKFYGQTDSEVAVNYFSYLMTKNNDNNNHLENLKEMSTILHGSWAILIIDKLNPGKIYYMKKGSPLLFGFDENRSQLFFTSELAGFPPNVNYYYAINDNDFGEISLTNFITSQQGYTANIVPKMNIETSPHPYPHWTIKEIHDQPQSINNLLNDRYQSHNILFPEFDDSSYKTIVLTAEHIIFLGCGTSYNAAKIGVNYFKELNSRGVTFDVIDGADFGMKDVPIGRQTLLILLSQSGETKDLMNALEIGKKLNLIAIGIINVENSLISRQVDVCLYLKAGREQAVASTKCFTNQYLMLLLLALWFNDCEYNKYSTYYDALDTIERDFNMIVNYDNSEINNLAKYLNNHTSCYILGKHISEWIAKEGSLKIKEIASLHIESYSISALKHGPYSLLCKDFPVIVLANDDEYYTKINSVVEEMKSRKAAIIIITNKENVKNKFDYLCYIPVNNTLFPLIANVILQKIAYELALIRNKNPDMPENLAKVVTVE